MKKSHPNNNEPIKNLNTKQDHGQVYTTNRQYMIWVRTLSEKTKETYDYSLDQFFAYTKEHKPRVKDLTSLSKMKRENRQELLEDYTIHLADKKITRNTVKLYLSALESFMTFHDVPYSRKKIHRFFPVRTKPAGSQGYSVEELQGLVNGFSSLRGKSMILLIASSGMRRGGYANLKVGDLVPIEDCYVIRVDANTHAEYVTFCTPEARKMTEKYLEQRKESGENITSDSPVFKAMTGEKEGGDRCKMVTHNICSVIKKVKLEKDRTTSCKDVRYDKATVHGMRKFCNTQLNKAKLQANDIEKIMGHQNGLKGLYYDPDNKDLFDEYKAAIPYLTILKENRQELEIEQLKEKSVEDEVAISEQIIDLKQTIEMLQRKIILYEHEELQHSS